MRRHPASDARRAGAIAPTAAHAACRRLWLLALAPLVLACGEQRIDEVPEGYQRACAPIVFFEADEPPLRAAVIGEFNAWSTEATPLVDSNGDGVYQARVDAPPGRHTYLIFADGRAQLDPYNPLTLIQDGQERSVLDVPDCDRPELTARGVETSPDGLLFAELRMLRAVDNATIDPPSFTATLRGFDGRAWPLRAVVSPEGDVSLEAAQLPAGRYTLTVEARDERGRDAEPLTLTAWVEERPFDWRDAIIYQVFIDRFRRGDGGPLGDDAEISMYHGGDLAGVTAAIREGYFEDLGANVLWLSPVYENPEGQFVGRDGYLSEPYHGYWPRLPRAVEARFGGEQALEELIEAAHAHGLRVIVDTVLNHLHVEHPYYQLVNGSPDWFNNPDGSCLCGLTCSWAAHIEDCWFDPFLADLRWENEEVVEQMIDDAVYWVERYNLDGLRLDAVPMMPRLALRHLRHELRQRLEHADHHVYLLGETFTNRGDQDLLRYYIGPDTLSGQFDFPVMWALRSALKGEISMVELEAEVAASASAWADTGAVMAPILGNHDVPRFISDVHGDVVWSPREVAPPQPDDPEPYRLLRLAWTFLMTQPGAPVIYYGDEIGLAGANDPDNRRNMRFGEEIPVHGHAVREHVKALTRARACHPALRRGEREVLIAHENFTIYTRDIGDGHPTLVILNRAALPREVNLTVPEELALADGVVFHDHLGSPVQSEGRAVTVTVPAQGSALLMTRCTEENP